MQVRFALLWALAGLSLGWPGESIAASPETGSIEQRSEGACSPPVIDNEGHVSISCPGVTPEALHYLENHLSETFGGLREQLHDLNDTQRTIKNLADLNDNLRKQADDWAQRYRDLNSKLTQVPRSDDKEKIATYIRSGDFQSAEKMIQSVVTAQFGPLPVRLAFDHPSVWQRLSKSWRQILIISSIFYGLSFTVLLLLTRRYSWAFRILSDAVWAKWLTWPFFLLRRFPAMQRWMLEPWFQEIRCRTEIDVDFLDPPISNTSGSQIEGTALLYRLKVAKRVWLQGRSGMGKSAVFAAWERAYFAAAKTPNLNTAIRQYGFILIMLPVRYYAALSVPEPNRPESWVLEMVRRRLEQFGFATRDLGLIDAMLKTGHIALALDGANEADRDTAIITFAHQFSQVRLLITSQSAAPEDWESWHLPETIEGLSKGLLMLWLGDKRGSSLSQRIEAGGLSETIISGYDLRLVADLVGPDPVHTPLPADRIDLYRAMLARARGSDGQPIRLEGLKQLAWTMVTQRRREIVFEDEKLLGVGILQTLAKEGTRIVWRVGVVHEFRHDQMRAFLAASWLYEETPNLSVLEKVATDGGVFALNRRDQDELWRFLAALLVSDETLKALWRFANEDPETRAILLTALQAEADDRDITLVRVARRRRQRSLTETVQKS